MEFNEIIRKEQEILYNTDWYPLLRGFIYSKRFESIFADMIYLVNHGKHFAPTLKNIFKPFTTCKYSDLKLILYNGDHEQYDYLSNNGLCYGDNTGCNSGRYHLFKNNIKVQNGSCLPKSPYGMEEYAKQGVLCLNNTMSFSESIEHDIKLWRPFYDYLFEMIENKDDIVFVEIGNVDQSYFKDPIYVDTLMDPYKSKGIFEKIDQELTKKGKEKINW